MLAGNRLLPALYVGLAGLAIDFLELRVLRIYAFGLHLTAHDGAFKGDYTQVQAGGSLHDHHITEPYILRRVVDIEALTGILETYLKNALVGAVLGILEPVVVSQLAAARPVAAAGFPRCVVGHHAAAGTVVLYGFFILHLKIYIVCPPGR